MVGLFRAHEQAMLNNQIACVALVTAYRLNEPLTVAPVETPSPAWEEAREQEEARHGVRLVKFFNRTWEE